MKVLVSGRSMEPVYKSGDLLRVKRFGRPRVGDVVVIKDPRDGRLLLKRVREFVGREVFVVGDNPAESTDSRAFGTIRRDLIVGKVIRGGRFG